jgi:hypothetical protein
LASQPKQYNVAMQNAAKENEPAATDSTKTTAANSTTMK